MYKYKENIVQRSINVSSVDCEVLTVIFTKNMTGLCKIPIRVTKVIITFSILVLY